MRLVCIPNSHACRARRASNLDTRRIFTFAKNDLFVLNFAMAAGGVKSLFSTTTKQKRVQRTESIAEQTAEDTSDGRGEVEAYKETGAGGRREADRLIVEGKKERRHVQGKSCYRAGNKYNKKIGVLKQTPDTSILAWKHGELNPQCVLFSPVYETSRSRRNVLLDKPGRRQAGQQSHGSQDAVCPRSSNLAYKSLHGIARGGAAETASGEDDAVGATVLAATVLRRRRGDGHEAEAGAHAEKDAGGEEESGYAAAVDGEAAGELLLGPRSATPSMPVRRAPTARMTRALKMAMKEMEAMAREPMYESVAGLETPLSTSRPWMTPQL
ncbi:hypothetical protein PWT90_10659 [Aphanocladium album]|nr:hypothetical protein PWT90_10659 [Aphanocladium album]